MMGYQPPAQAQLFYTAFNLEGRVRADHPLRAVAAQVDCDFAYQAVVDKYGDNGNVSVPPPVILKLMLLLTLYNVRSERELMATMPERLDWLWFVGYDLDSPIPDHSVLSKARKRWGLELFKSFFERIVWACVQAGLVDGSKIFVDSSLIEANAANSSIMDRYSLKAQISERYPQLERRLSEIGEAELAQRGAVNQRHVSVTDPEATIVRRGRPQLCYQTHRAVDARAEVITATEVTRGDANEAHRLMALWQAHAHNTERVADTVVADSKYGTIENFLACHDHGIAAHMPDLKQAAIQRAKARATFPDSEFLYDPHSDTYRCPAGQTLKRKFLHRRRDRVYYGTLKKATCTACPLRARCTRSKNQRLIERHLREDILDLMRAASRSSQARGDIRTRQHLMERSFARAKRFGFDHARWRGRWRLAIQEYLTAAIQNIEVPIRYARNPRRSLAAILTELGKVPQAMLDRLRNQFLWHRDFFGCEHSAALNPHL